MVEQPSLSDLCEQLDLLHHDIIAAGQTDEVLLDAVHPDHRESALNLLHYLALRSVDLRRLQHGLSRWGLSSLGRCEAHVAPTIDLVRSAARAINGDENFDVAHAQELHDIGEARLGINSDALFGPRRYGRATRVMATLPTESADDPDFIGLCAERGSALFRINSAHDDPQVWQRMISRIRDLPAEHRAMVFIDLAGPKLRTGPIAVDPKPGRGGKKRRPRIRVNPGQLLIVTSDLTPADPGASEVRIGCTIASVLDAVRVGQRVYFDDGKFGGPVVDVTTSDSGGREVHVRLADIDQRGAWLRAEKGINLPDTDLKLPALTDEDRAVLPFIVEHADGLHFSFVNNAEDIVQLRDALADLGAPDFPIVVKMETARGFGNLPGILLEVMRSPRIGVMIARGDLAVEAGWTRMGELQEEIMWLCEAAHIPVIWATQVLENLAKSGRPSRAEVTDAALSVRSECVMLNKGPHILSAISFLDDMLTRMAGHLDKKSPLLRRLRLSPGPA
ncbi:MAG: pyruvate kinase [Brooklawnia sp.]|jgi:pyruvate kinase